MFYESHNPNGATNEVSDVRAVYLDLLPYHAIWEDLADRPDENLKYIFGIRDSEGEIVSSSFVPKYRTNRGGIFGEFVDDSDESSRYFAEMYVDGSGDVVLELGQLVTDDDVTQAEVTAAA